MNPSDPLPSCAVYANDRWSADVEDGGHCQRQSEQTPETKNQKLKRLSIDDANQTFRRSIVFSDTQPVKVTAKIEYIGGNSGITRMNVSNKHDGDSRFPRIEEMAHFHYDSVEFSSPLRMCLFETKEPGKRTFVDEEEDSVKIKVSCRDRSWVIIRYFADFVGLDKQFHRSMHKMAHPGWLLRCLEKGELYPKIKFALFERTLKITECVYDRKYTGLESLKGLKSEHTLTPNLKQRLKIYIERLSEIAGNTIWCGPILNWFEVDNRGNHLLLTEDSAINVPAVAAAHVMKRYTAQASDEISFEDLITWVWASFICS